MKEENMLHIVYIQKNKIRNIDQIEWNVKNLN